MSLFGTILGGVGGTLIGRGVDYLYDAFVPESMQTGISSFMNSIGVKKSIGQVAGDATKALLQPKEKMDFNKMPTGSTVGGSNFSSRGGFQAGQAQMIPFGRTDRVSRAMQDQRVANKLMKMAQGYRVPNPNIRLGSNITLASATKPAVSLARKYSKGTVKA